MPNKSKRRLVPANLANAFTIDSSSIPSSVAAMIAAAEFRALCFLVHLTQFVNLDGQDDKQCNS